MTLAITPYQPMTPAEFAADVNAAQLKAKTLTALAEAQKLYTQIGAGKHLRVEGWLTIGRAYGYTTGTGELELLHSADGEFYGVKAVAYVYDGNGIRVGQAESYCTKDEENWSDKPLAQMAGMAQTRAVSRALRQLLAWVVVLAGYSATPAEEMMAARAGGAASTPVTVALRGFCPVHKVPFVERPGGVSKGTGRPYPAFWACPTKVGRGYCQEKPQAPQEAPVEPTEEDLGYSERDEPLDVGAPVSPQEPRVAMPAATGGATHAHRGQKADEPDYSYFFSLAREAPHNLPPDAALQLLRVGSWEAWAKQHGATARSEALKRLEAQP